MLIPMEKFLTLMIALQTRVANRDENGQGTLEYLGMALVAGIIVLAVVAAVGDGSVIGDAFSGAIEKVTSIGS